MRSLRLFLRVVKLAILQQTTYRTALIAGLATNVVWGVLRASVVVALYAGHPIVNGLTLQASLTYVAVGQAMIAFLFLFGSYDLMATVYSGSIAADLVRPVGLFSYWLGRDIGRSLVNLLFRGLILILVFMLFYTIAFPLNPLDWLWTALSLCLAWLTSFAWRFLINIASFWTPDARGLGRAAFTASEMLSGFLIPLRLYPDWFANICRLTPFPTMFNTSLEIYLGLVKGPDLWLALLVQAAWALVLSGLCFLALRAGLRRLVIQGG